MFNRVIEGLCRLALRHPFSWLAVLAVIALPAWFQVQNLRLDTNLKRLLPEHSRAVQWSRELSSITGDGGYFSVLFEGDDHAALQSALVAAAAEIRALDEVREVELEREVEFFERFRYTLLKSSFLEEMLDKVYELQAEANPLIVSLDDGPGEAQGDRDAEAARAEARRDDADRRALIARYGKALRYNESDDGRVMGMIVRTAEGIGNLGSLRRLHAKLEAIAGKHAAAAGLWHGVSGNLRNRVAEYDQIMGDLTRAGTVSLFAIVLTLAVSFGTLRVLPVVLLPLSLGLLWSFALVPWLVGELNTITSFLLMVLFGMGVDYTIHLVKRYQAELAGSASSDNPDVAELEGALLETYRSTGRSVLTSGLTTALGLAILAISDFRGFSDFGVIGGSSMLIVLLAMFIVLPPALVVGQRWHLVLPSRPRSRRALLAPGWVTAALAVAVVAAAVVAYRGVAFDYDFTRLSANVTSLDEVKERHREVYRGVSAPAAIYVVRDIETLDEASRVFAEARVDEEGKSTVIGAVSSLRDLAPGDEEMELRRDIIAEIHDTLDGRWVERVEDESDKELIDDFRAFEPPPAGPALDEVPASLKRKLMARDDSGELIIGVDTNGGSKDGRVAMAFTRALYDLVLPDGVRGPTGDKPVLAEILWLVTSESPRIIGLTFLGIFLIVLIDLRSLRGTLWVLLPLVAGLLLTLGVMVVLGWKLNFFNMVVLPTMLGIGVDHGVHYYRRWKELGRDTRATQHELFEPLTVCSLTTIMGYVGMNLANHPGLLAIGRLAVVGLTCSWLTALLLLPGLLHLRERSLAAHKSTVAEPSTAESNG